MKAKDTMIEHIPDLTPSQQQLYGQLRPYLEAQAEISFKAGIKEVLEWVDDTDVGDELYVKVNRDHWDKAKLKEWNL